MFNENSDAVIARTELITELVTSTQAQVAAVSQAATRLIEGDAPETTAAEEDRIKVQAWLDDAARLASLLNDVNHPDLKALAAGLDAHTDSFRHRLKCQR